jgi:hypothetical protein
MNIKSTILLALVFAGLCAAYGWREWRAQDTVKKADEAKLVFDWTGDDVREIAITRVGEKTVRAARAEAGGWTISEPHPTIVPFVLLWDRVAENLAGLRNERSIEVPLEDLAEYGLVDPALELDFQVGGKGASHRLRFGEITPTQEYRYAQLDADEIMLVSTRTFFELDRSLVELRSRFLVDDREAPVLRFEFARIAQGNEEADYEIAAGEESVLIALERDDPEALWRMTSPVECSANQELAGSLVEAVQFATGWGHVDAPENLSDYGLDPPGARVTVMDAGLGARQTVYFGHMDVSGEEEGIYVKRENNPAVFLVAAHLFGSFPKHPDILRDRRLLTSPITAMTRIQYFGPKGDFVMEKDGPVWNFNPPLPEGNDPPAVSQFLTNLARAQGVFFPEEGGLSDFGLDDPQIRIVAGFGAGVPDAEIRLHPYAEDDRAWVATQDAGHITLVATEDAEGLLAGRDQFHSRDLLRFSKKNALRIALHFEGEDYRFEKAHGTWVVKAPEGKVFGAQSDARILLDALSPLLAEAVETVQPEDGADYGLQDPRASILVETHDPVDPAGPQPHGPLEIGAVCGDNSQQRFARVQGRQGVFRLSQTVIDAVRDCLAGLMSGG